MGGVVMCGLIYQEALFLCEIGGSFVPVHAFFAERVDGLTFPSAFNYNSRLRRNSSVGRAAHS